MPRGALSAVAALWLGTPLLGPRGPRGSCGQPLRGSLSPGLSEFCRSPAAQIKILCRASNTPPTVYEIQSDVRAPARASKTFGGLCLFSIHHRMPRCDSVEAVDSISWMGRYTPKLPARIRKKAPRRCCIAGALVSVPAGVLDRPERSPVIIGQ